MNKTIAFFFIFAGVLKRLFISSVLLTVLIPAAAERFHARPAALESIGNGTVYAVTQDSKNAVWLGTSYGLCRYNGVELQTISKLVTVHPFATGNDKDIFYCQCDGCILKVNAGVCKTTVISTDALSSNIRSIAVKDSKVIAGGDRSLFIEDCDSLRLWMTIPQEYGTPKLLRNTPSGRLFLSTSSNNLLEIIEDRLFLRAELSDELCDIYEDRNYKLWLGFSTKGISVYSHDFRKRTGFRPEDRGKPARRIRSFTEDFEGNIFAGGLDGLYLITAGGDCIPEDSYTPEGYAICDMFRDVSDNIWIGTFYGGAFLCEKNVSPFTGVESFKSSQPRISTGLIEDKRGDMWLITDQSGMYRFPRDGSAAQYIRGSADFKMKNAWYDREKDAIWISLYLQPFSRYDIATGRWTVYDFITAEGKKTATSGFHIAKVGDDFWIAGSNEIHLFNEKSEKAISRTLPGFKGHPRNLCPAEDGSVLICSNGLFRWKDGRIRKLSDLDGSLCFDAVQDNDIIWVGTNSGLFQCDTSGKVRQHFDNRNVGLGDNFVYAVMPLQGERLLLGTNGGVSILNTAESECFNYSTRNGLSLSSVQEGCITQRTDGSVWIAGTDGIARFDPSDHRIPKSCPRISIDKITVNGREIDLKGKTPVRLSHKENNIFVQSSNFDFAGIVPTFCQCRLLPHEKEWKDFKTNTPISYMGLKSGNYRIEIRSINSLISLKTCGIACFDFRVCHPWYWSPIAWVIYIILLTLYVRWQVVIISESRARQRVRNAKDVSIVAQNDLDTDFIRSTEKIISEHLSDSAFSVDTLCQEMDMTYRNLSSKLKGLTGYLPRDFIEVIRMRKASELLLDNKMNISSIAYEVGFNSPQYFATRFKKHFGETPVGFKTSHKVR